MAADNVGCIVNPRTVSRAAEQQQQRTALRAALMLRVRRAMKRLWPMLVLAGLASTAGPSRAAGIALGADVGLSVSHFQYDRPENLLLPESRYGSTVWVRGGIYGAYPIVTRLAVLTGLVYESSGGKADLGDGTTVTDRVEYATIPLLVEGAYPAGRLQPIARLGIECGFRADTDVLTTVDGHRQGHSVDVDDQYPAVEWTLLLDVGLRVMQRWDAHVGYRYGLTNVNDTLNRSDHPIHGRSVIVGVTHWFTRRNT